VEKDKTFLILSRISPKNKKALEEKDFFRGSLICRP
jgi:hypothetical protein